MGSFWNFYSDFANGLTVGSATYGYDSDDFNAWKGTDGIKLGFGIAIANSDTDYEVLYNKRYNLPIATFVEQTPTPLPPFLLDASQITYIVTGTSGFEIQGPYNSYIQQSLDNYGGSVGYKNNAYKLALVLNANVSLKTSDNQIIPGLKEKGDVVHAQLMESNNRGKCDKKIKGEMIPIEYQKITSCTK